MMATVKVLVEGYVSGENNEQACCTISLVQTSGVCMVVDPGTVKHPKIIVDALRKEGLAINDINYVCITHSHMDHYRNIGMFPDAKALDFYGIWERDKVVDWNSQFTKDIQIIKTPGHDRTGITLLVKTEQGMVVICGDVFWKENHPEEEPYADDMEKLKKSRKLVLAKADFIVPGHDGIYKARKIKI